MEIVTLRVNLGEVDWGLLGSESVCDLKIQLADLSVI